MIRAVIDEGGAPVVATFPGSPLRALRALRALRDDADGAHLGALGRNAPHETAGRVLRLALV